jgi:hypothetical protein
MVIGAGQEPVTAGRLATGSIPPEGITGTADIGNRSGSFCLYIAKPVAKRYGLSLFFKNKSIVPL